MEFEQIIKKIDWLDEERRKDKEKIAELEAQLKSTKTSLSRLSKQRKEMADQLSLLTSLPARVDKFEESLSKQKKLINKQTDGKVKGVEEQLKHDLDLVKKKLIDYDKTSASVTEIQKTLEAYSGIEIRLSKLVSDSGNRIEEMMRENEAIRTTLVRYEQNQTQDSKRLSDIQGETTALRKRLSELREKIDIHADNFRRYDSQIKDIGKSEQELAQFYEQQAHVQAERDQLWKDWRKRFEKLGEESSILEARLSDWDATQRAAKRAQEAFEEISQKYERRINEISEMQRLAEDRFRQEWVTFKSDDQKRWSSFTLSQNERLSDDRTDMEKLFDRVTSLEDMTQNQQDIIQQSKEAEEEYFQGLLAQIHELLSAYERIMSTSR